MKQMLAAVGTAVVLLTSAIPAVAEDHHDNNRGHAQYHHAAPPPRRVAAAHRYREGQVWHGHHLAYRGGNWGYYQPRNGAQVFIQIPI
jgi:hypothetical protein